MDISWIGHIIKRRPEVVTLLLRQMTGHKEQPSVQQQQTQPQNSHLTFTGSVFFRTLFIRRTVALNSSGATRDTRPLGNSDSKRLLRPNLQGKINWCFDLLSSDFSLWSIRVGDISAMAFSFWMCSCCCLQCHSELLEESKHSASSMKLQIVEKSRHEMCICFVCSNNWKVIKRF